MHRLKWYHFYSILATFDIIIIAAGLWLHHRTLNNLGSLLESSNRLDSSQRALAALRRRVIELNAPGNDVFRTRDVARERSRYDALLRSVEQDAATARRTLPAQFLDEFQQKLRHMQRAEEDIFAQLSVTSRPSDELWGAAATKMAEMDEHQAAVLRVLEGRSAQLLENAAALLNNHQRTQEYHGVAEFLLASALVIALVGMMWYTRKLQQTEVALVTERQRVETERRERLAAIGELCSGVAHGIQNPLASIQSSTELILDLGKIDETTRRRAQDVIEECSRLTRRVRRLLTFARAELQPRERLPLGRAIDQVVQELAPRLAERGVRATVARPATEMLVLADPDELGSIFIELISNALDHSPDDSTINVRIGGDGRFAVVEVADAGSGVPPSAAANIFDLFYTTKPGGTGIGLATTRRIVHGLGGTIALVHSDGRHGATFRVRLPLAP